MTVLFNGSTGTTSHKNETSPGTLASMQDFTKSLKFIITFLVLVILMNMFTNQKITFNFLVLVLVSMLVLNSDKVKDMIGGLSYDG
jgi:chromate transport protein ChrA